MTAAYHKEIFLGLNEDSVRKRKARVKSTTPVKTTSRLHAVTNQLMEKLVPDRKYDSYHGSTRNDMITLVNLPPYESMWNVTPKQKAEIYHHVDGTRLIASQEDSF